IWVESLAAALVLVALVTAVAAHRQQFDRPTAPVVVALLLFALAVAAAAGVCVLNDSLHDHFVSRSQFLATFAWALSLAVGAVFVLVAAAAAHWQRFGRPAAPVVVAF